MINKRHLSQWLTVSCLAMFAMVVRPAFAHNVIPDCGLSLTAKVSLYDAMDRPVVDFNQKLIALKGALPGTVVDFGSAGQVIFRNVLGMGSTFFIFESADGDAIRVPIARTTGDRLANIAGDLHQFAELQQEYEKAGIRVVGLNLEKSRLPRFGVVELVDEIRFSLFDLKMNRVKFNKGERQTVEDRLIDFARGTWRYAYVGDFSESQLVYNGHEWILLDFGYPQNLIVNPRQLRNTFSPVQEDGDVHHFVSPELYARIEAAIAKERMSHADDDGVDDDSNSVWFRRALDDRGRQVSELMLQGETSLEALIGKTAVFYGDLLNKENRKELLKGKGDPSFRTVSVRIDKVKKAGEKSVLFKVTVAEKYQGLLELSTDVQNQRDTYHAGQLLKSKGYSKSDWSAEGPDFVLVIKY